MKKRKITFKLKKIENIIEEEITKVLAEVWAVVEAGKKSPWVRRLFIRRWQQQTAYQGTDDVIARSMQARARMPGGVAQIIGAGDDAFAISLKGQRLVAAEIATNQAARLPRGAAGASGEAQGIISSELIEREITRQLNAATTAAKASADDIIEASINGNQTRGVVEKMLVDSAKQATKKVKPAKKAAKKADDAAAAANKNAQWAELEASQAAKDALKVIDDEILSVQAKAVQTSRVPKSISHPGVDDIAGTVVDGSEEFAYKIVNDWLKKNAAVLDDLSAKAGGTKIPSTPVTSAAEFQRFAAAFKAAKDKAIKMGKTADDAVAAARGAKDTAAAAATEAATAANASKAAADRVINIGRQMDDLAANPQLVAEVEGAINAALDSVCKQTLLGSTKSGQWALDLTDDLVLNNPAIQKLINPNGPLAKKLGDKYAGLFYKDATQGVQRSAMEVIALNATKGGHTKILQTVDQFFTQALKRAQIEAGEGATKAMRQLDDLIANQNVVLDPSAVGLGRWQGFKQALATGTRSTTIGIPATIRTNWNAAMAKSVTLPFRQAVGNINMAMFTRGAMPQASALGTTLAGTGIVLGGAAGTGITLFCLWALKNLGALGYHWVFGGDADPVAQPKAAEDAAKVVEKADGDDKKNIGKLDSKKTAIAANMQKQLADAKDAATSGAPNAATWTMKVIDESTILPERAAAGQWFKTDSVVAQESTNAIYPSKRRRIQITDSKGARIGNILVHIAALFPPGGRPTAYKYLYYYEGNIGDIVARLPDDRGETKAWSIDQGAPENRRIRIGMANWNYFISALLKVDDPKDMPEKFKWETWNTFFDVTGGSKGITWIKGSD